jgi:hypothetical protein
MVHASPQTSAQVPYCSARIRLPRWGPEVAEALRGSCIDTLPGLTGRHNQTVTVTVELYAADDFDIFRRVSAATEGLFVFRFDDVLAVSTSRGKARAAL